MDRGYCTKSDDDYTRTCRRSRMEIIVGTYDEVILGFRVVNVGKKLQLEACFTDRSHAGCVRCVAISPKGVLASGGSDETIRLLNLKKQRELGSLVHHNGSITSLEFYKGFLFSASEDQKLCIWKAYTWECLRTLKGHKAGINSLSVHPTGKMALTVSKDKSLHTWNLLTARTAFVTNIKQVADIVKWSPDGDTYVIATQNKIEVYSVETGEVQFSIQAETKVNCVQFLNSTTCLYGGEGGIVTFHDIRANKQLHTCDTGSVRIKGMCVCQSPLDDDEEKVLIVGSSDGYLKMYRISTDKQDKITTTLLTEHNTAFRITCLAVYTPKSPEVCNIDTKDDTKVASKKQLKRKKPQQDSNSDEEADQDSVDEDEKDIEDAPTVPVVKKKKTEKKKKKQDVLPAQTKAKKSDSVQKHSREGVPSQLKTTVSQIKRKKKKTNTKKKI